MPDILAPGLRVVFCGTALGLKSAQARAYYANPGNFFWRTLHRIGLTPRQLAPQEYPHVLDYSIGLTDLCKTAYGQDAELPLDAFDIAALTAKITQYQPRYLAFTSKTGAAAFLGTPTAQLDYGLYTPTANQLLHPFPTGQTRIFILPSPSGQARIFWNEMPWQQLADAVKWDEGLGIGN